MGFAPKGRVHPGPRIRGGFSEAWFFFVKSPIFWGVVGKMAELTPWLTNGG